MPKIVIRELICPVCNTPFHTTEPARKFCSYQCYLAKHHPGMLVPKRRNCLQCGNEFQTKRAAKFCSSTCKSAYHNKKNDIPGRLRRERAERKSNQNSQKTSSQSS